MWALCLEVMFCVSFTVAMSVSRFQARGQENRVKSKLNTVSLDLNLNVVLIYVKHCGVRGWLSNVAGQITMATGTGSNEMVWWLHQLVSSDAHPTHNDRPLFGRQRK